MKFLYTVFESKSHSDANYSYNNPMSNEVVNLVAQPFPYKFKPFWHSNILIILAVESNLFGSKVYNPPGFITYVLVTYKPLVYVTQYFQNRNKK